MRRFGAMLVGVALAASATCAEAREPDVCEADHLRAQEDREHGALLRAREELLRCAASTCPSLVQADCARWLEGVTNDLPTIVVSARSSDGPELRAVRVTLDGAPFLDELEGKAMPLDPGPHVLRFVSKELGAVEVEIVAKTGAKNEPVTATFVAPLRTGLRPSAIATWSLVGAGGAGLALFAGLSIAGQVQYHHLEKSCAPRCRVDDVERVRSEFIAGDVSLALGGALVGAGLIVYLATPPGPTASRASGVVPPSTALFVQPERSGASAQAIVAW